MRISDWSSDVCSSDLNDDRYQHHNRCRMDRGLALQIAGQDVALRLVALAGGDLFRRQPFEHRAMFVIGLENVAGPAGERFDMVADDVDPAFARQDRKSTRLNSSH